MKKKSKIVYLLIVLVVIIAAVVVVLVLQGKHKSGESSNAVSNLIDDGGEIEFIIPEGQTGEGF